MEGWPGAHPNKPALGSPVSGEQGARRVGLQVWALLPRKTCLTPQCPERFSQVTSPGGGAGGQGPRGQGAGRARGRPQFPGACGSGETGGCGFIRRRGRSHHPRQPPSRSTLTSSTRCSKHAAGLPVCGLLCPPPSAFSTARPPTASLGGAAPRAGLDSPHPLPLGWGCRAHKALPAPHCPSWPSAQPSSHSVSVVIATPFRVVRPAV